MDGGDGVGAVVGGGVANHTSRKYAPPCCPPSNHIISLYTIFTGS